MTDGPRTVLRNDFNKETFIFTNTDDPNVARFDVLLGKGGSGGGNALVHVHPLAEERFLVASGRIKVVVNGREQLVGPGEQAGVRRVDDLSIGMRGDLLDDPVAERHQVAGGPRRHPAEIGLAHGRPAIDQVAPDRVVRGSARDPTGPERFE